MCEWKPIRASLTNITAKGTMNANARLENIAPPKSAMAAMGAKFGGWGNSRLAMAKRINTAMMAF